MTIPGVRAGGRAGSSPRPRGRARGSDGGPAPGLQAAVAPRDFYSGGTAWTGKHEAWLRGQHFAAPARQLAYDSAFDAMLATLGRRDRLDIAIAAMAADSVYSPVVTRLQCLCGVSTLTAFALAVEIGGLAPVQRPLDRCLRRAGPSESSSGAIRAQGSITKTSNGFVRRLLIEAAWHHHPPYRPGVTLRRR